MTVRVIVGDALDVLRTLDAASIDAVVTDPPYGLKFMSKAWDSFKAGDIAMRRSAAMDAVNAGASRQGGRQRACADYQKRQARDMVAFQQWATEWAAEALRAAKPGTHLLAFGGTRTYHRLTCAIEDAGWEIRDCLMWLYGSGFPKSRDIGKDFDKGLRPVIGEQKAPGHALENVKQGAQSRSHITFPKYDAAPITEEARQWQGWGTALKPAWEPIILARKPLVGTVAANVQRHGTGALNIDGCRIGTESTLGPRSRNSFGLINDDGWQPKPGVDGSASGRWPANVVLDEDAAAMLDEQSGSSRASRFFYNAKASRSEREAMEGGPRNHHPTVKPLDLMRWLVRLVTPPNGLILDPFCGSGTTGCAALAEGFRFLGIDREAEYVAIAEARLNATQPGLSLGEGT